MEMRPSLRLHFRLHTENIEVGKFLSTDLFLHYNSEVASLHSFEFEDLTT